MLDSNTQLKLLRGKDIKIDSDITIKSITIGEIIDNIGLDLYNVYVGYIAHTPFDLRAQLYELGIIHSEITHWQLFLNNFMHSSDNSFSDSMKNLLGFDINKYKAYSSVESNEIYLMSYDGNKIDEMKFSYIVNIIREMNGYPDVNKEPKFGNQTALIYETERHLRRLKKRRNTGLNVTLKSIISSIVWTEGSININNVWDLTLYQLYDGLNRKIKKEQYGNLMTGIYTGNISKDSVNFNKENWFTD